MKLTAAYFASGTTPMNLDSWWLEKLILIDKSFQKTEMIGKVWKLKCDAFKAVDILKEKGIKLDVFISINEGLCEGGGEYPMNGQFFLAYLMQILKDEYFHIYAPKYYTQQIDYRWHFPNLPYTIQALKKDDYDFDLSLLNNAGKYLPKVLKMKRNIDQTVVHPLFSNIQIHWKSIWEEANNLKGIFIPDGSMLPYLTRFLPKIHIFQKGISPIEQFNLYDLSNGDVIGITPWSSLDYPSEIAQLDSWAKNKGVTVKIFYLDSKDKNKLFGRLSTII